MSKNTMVSIYKQESYLLDQVALDLWTSSYTQWSFGKREDTHPALASHHQGTL